MGKYILDDPIHWNESGAKGSISTTKGSIKVFGTNSDVSEILYIGDVAFKGYIWNNGTADFVGVISLTRRREAADPVTNLYDVVSGDDLADTRARKTFAMSGVPSGGNTIPVPFTIRMKGMAKLKYTDDFIMQAQSREGTAEFAGDITWSVAKNVKLGFDKRRSSSKRK